MRLASVKVQRGATLLVGLVMLILMTLFAITVFKLSKGNLQVVAGMQQRGETMAAAQEAIEKVVSNTTFKNTPANAIPNSTCGVTTPPNTLCVDSRGDGVKTTVVVTPTCLASQVIPVAALSFTAANDVGCLVGISQTAGILGSTTNNSLCANMLWNINAVATDSNTSAQYAIDQGEGIRVSANKTCFN